MLTIITGGCSSPTPEPELNVLITPDLSNPTPTPFQPKNDSNHSPYGDPVVASTFLPSLFTSGTLTAEDNLLPTPFPSGYQGMPVFILSTNTNPLTGLTATDPKLLERRPLAIKITQFPRYTRPQSGLTLADVVYEYYIEDGLTRFIAIFYGNDAAQVGPVRSGRFFDEHIARMYQAFLVFKYADPRVYDYLKESDLSDYLIVPGRGSCPPFFIGESDRDTYNNIFFNSTKFNECIAKRSSVDNVRPPLHSSFFSTLPPKSDQIAERIYTKYSVYDYNYWEYLPGENRYQRYQEIDSLTNDKNSSFAPLYDGLTNSHVKADNVVVLFVQHRFESQFHKEDQIYHIDLYASGDAFVFRDGIAIEAQWKRTKLDQPILLTSSLGAPIYLKPGNTFYQVIGFSSNSWREGTDWYFIWDSP